MSFYTICHESKQRDWIIEDFRTPTPLDLKDFFMKIMLYCQHVLGIGHFFRSMEIAGALKEHQVLFVEGGKPLVAFAAMPHVRRFFLPALMMDAEFRTMDPKDGALEEIKLERKQMLRQAFLEFAPDVLITELFPFGRKQFRGELLPILELIRENGLHTKAICSLRDILVEKNDQAAYEEGVLSILNAHYHLLLVHSDPRLVSLEETFERFDKIAPPVKYTGFIARQAPPRSAEQEIKIIAASSGGGKVGVDLLLSVIGAIRVMEEEDLRLRVFIGPLMDEKDKAAIANLADRDKRISALPFSMDFLSELARADLSISMAGYNTCMDILSSGVKALVYPFAQNREQSMRADKLRNLGLARVIERLEASSMASLIRNALREPFSAVDASLDLQGAANTAKMVEQCASTEAKESEDLQNGV